MNKQTIYEPTKCSNTECAYPKRTCEWCFCNVTRYGRYAVKAKDPKSFYAWVRELSTRKP